MIRYIAALLCLIALSDVASAACGPLRARFQVFGTRTRIVERSRSVVARPFLVATTAPRVLRIVPAAAPGGCVNGACAIPGTPAKK